jgi:hypothetical protein
LEFLTAVAPDDEPPRPPGDFRDRSTPKRSMMASSAVAIGGKAQSCSIIRSRAARPSGTDRCAARRSSARSGIAVFVGEHRHQATGKLLAR